MLKAILFATVATSLVSGLLAQGLPSPPLPGGKGDLRPLPPVPKFPDPAVVSVTAALVSHSADFPETRGKVRIHGVVRNIGLAAYRSNPGQQGVHLYEKSPGGKPRLVASKTFQNLAPGEKATITVLRNWDTANEFPPSYEVVIDYDPDILLDGNTNNDDRNSKNNRLTLSSQTIDNLFNR